MLKTSYQIIQGSWLLNVLVVGSSGMFERHGGLMRLLEFERYGKMNTWFLLETLLNWAYFGCLGHLQNRRGLKDLDHLCMVIGAC